MIPAVSRSCARGVPLTLQPNHGAPWVCMRCYYARSDSVTDSFYQEQVNGPMLFCAGVLVFVSPSLLSSTRSSTLIKALITPLPLPIVLLIDLRFPLRTHASQTWSNRHQLMEPRGLIGCGTSCMSISHKLLSTPSLGVLRRRPSVATTTGSVCPSSNRSCACAHCDPPGSDFGSPAATAPAARTYHAARTALTDREQADFASTADRDHAPRRASRAYRQGRPVGSATGDHIGRFYARGGRARRRACAPPVSEQSTTMVQAEDMASTTRPAGVGRSASVCCPRARSSIH